MRQFLRLAYLMWACVVISCGGKDNNEPLLTGNYSGTIQDSLAGRGTIITTIVQNGENLQGTLQSRFADPTILYEGNLTGTIRNSSAPHPDISLFLQPTIPGTCPLQITGTLITPVEMTGNYTTVNCGNRVVTGTLDVTR